MKLKKKKQQIFGQPWYTPVYSPNNNGFRTLRCQGITCIYVIHMKNECQIIKKCAFLRDKYFAYEYIVLIRESWIYDLEPMDMDSLDVLQNNNMN